MRRLAGFLLVCAACSAPGGPDGPTGALRGQVVLEGSASVDGIELTLVGAVARGLAPDATGAYLVDALPPGDYQLFARGDWTREAVVTREVRVAAGEETLVPEVRFAPVAEVAGRVRLPGDEPPGGTLVLGEHGEMALTDEDGGFVIEVEITGAALTLGRAGYQPLAVPLGPLHRGARVEVGEHALAPAEAHSAVLAGEVTIAGGGDPAGVTVEVPALGRSTLTDAAGRFELRGVPTGTYQVRFQRGPLAETVDGVLCGLGAPKVVDERILDLGPVELIAATRLDRGRYSYRIQALSPDGRWLLASRCWAGCSLVVWDTRAGQAVREVPLAEEAWDLEAWASIRGDVARLALKRQAGGGLDYVALDLTTGGITPLLEKQDTIVGLFGGAVLARAGDGTVTFVSWDGPTLDLTGATMEPHDNALLVARPTAPTTGPWQVEWRSLPSGALVRAGTLPDRPKVAPTRDGGTLVLVSGGRLLAWTAAGSVDGGPAGCTTPSLTWDGAAVWCGATRHALPGLQVTATLSEPQALWRIHFSQDGAAALIVACDTRACALRRQRLPGSDVEDLGAVGLVQALPTRTGVWLAGAELLFVGSSGPVERLSSAACEQPVVADDGALLCIESRTAAGGTLVRIDPTTRARRTIDRNVVDRQWLSPDAVLVRHAAGVGQALVHVPTGAVAPLGRYAASRPVPSNGRWYFSRYAGSENPAYVGGLFRVELP